VFVTEMEIETVMKIES